MNAARQRPLLWLAVAVGLALAVQTGLRLAPRPGVAVGMTPVMRQVLTDPGSPAAGPRGAPVSVVVFTDYQCGVCRADHPGFERVRQARPDLRFVYKEWPILGARSRHAAQVALAAQRQGRWLEAHKALMTAPGAMDAATVKAAAVRAGIDWRRIEADLGAQAPAIDAQLRRHASQAFALGLQGTPAYVVGTDLYVGRMSERALKRAIRRAERAAATG